MVLDVAVGREERAVGGPDHAQGVLRVAVVNRGDEDAGGVQLVAAQLGHQARPGPVPQAPADQLFDCRSRVDHLARGVLDLLLLVAELRGVDDLVGDLGLNLDDLSLDERDLLLDGSHVAGDLLGLFLGFELKLFFCFEQALQVVVELLGQRIVEFALLRHRLLPAIVTGQVVAVPLGADVVQLAQHAAANQVDRAIVEDVVVPLVAGDQVQARLLGHPGHLLALVDRVAHELFGQHVQARLHGGHGRRGGAGARAAR